MTTLVENIGKRLQAARKAAGYRSATAFTSQHNIPLSTYSQHENGKRALGADMLMQYSQLLGVSPGWLLSGEDASADLPMMTLDLLPIQADAIATVDMTLFSQVLLRLVPVVAQYELRISHQDIVEFALDVYNGVIITSAGKEDKLAMVDLSIASLKRGAIKRGLERKTA